MAVALLLNSNAFDGARWRAGQELARQGTALDQIDVGYEWMGYHSTTTARPPSLTATTYRALWPTTVVCAIARSIEQPTDVGLPVGVVPYRLLLVSGPTELLHLYDLRSAGCLRSQG